MDKGKYRKKHSHIRKYTIIFTALLALLFMVGGVWAKYIYNNGGMNLLSAKEFYFTSNLLTENAAKYVLNSTTTEVSFILGNNFDKLRFSQDDIRYEITVECKSGGNIPTIVYEDDQRVLTGKRVDETSVTLQNLKMGETYIVTATGRAGYKQVLKAEFFVSDMEENVYKHLDTTNDAFVLLTVWAENVEGNLTIGVVKGGLIPDNTDPVLCGIYNYQDGEYRAMVINDSENYTDTYSSYTYRFFTSENTGYSTDDFDVFIENSGNKYLAEEKTPQ